MSKEHAASHLNKVFGHTDLYSLFEVSNEASAQEIKKAYMKLALKHHPDKGGDAEKFQAISIAYSILSDEEKRKIYDETGSLDDDDFDELNEQNFDFWYNYFRNLFPKVKISDIEKYQEKYIGSEEERNDIIENYKKFDGDLNKMMECILFAEEGNEERLIQIVEEEISKKTISKTSKFDKIKIQLLKKSQASVNGSKNQSNKTKQKKASKEEDLDSLAELIANKNKQKTASSQMFSNIFDKYDNKKRKNSEKNYDISDNEFEALQKKIIQSKDSNKKRK